MSELAVDIERCILAGGGAMHADCEAVLLNDGGKQEFDLGRGLGSCRTTGDL